MSKKGSPLNKATSLFCSLVATFLVSCSYVWDNPYDPDGIGKTPGIKYDASLVGDSLGNSDGAINPGEAIKLDIRVHNISGTDYGTVKAVLSSTSSYVTMSTISFTYGDIPSRKYASVYVNNNNYGTSATATDIAMNANATGAYRFSVSASTPAGTELPFTLTFTDSQNNTWTDTFSLTVVSSTTLSWSFTSAPAGFTGTWYLSASKWRSAVIGNNGTSTTSVTFTASARVNALVAFTYGGDSEASCDRIHFSIDGNEQTLFPDSGRLFTATFSQTASLASGSHTLQFWYSKDGSLATGSDYVWINSLSVRY